MATNEKKKYIYEIISNSGEKPNILGEIWWTGKTIDCDVPRVMSELNNVYITNKTIGDGLDFFNLLPLHYRNGYITLRRKK